MNVYKKQWIFTLLIVLAALSAGSAAAAFIANSIIGSMQFTLTTQQELPQQISAPNATQVTEARRSTVAIYKQRNGAAPLDKVLLPTDKIGSGAVITSDGWIMTAGSVLVGRDRLVAVFSDNTTLTIDPITAVRDDATGVAFVKLDAQRLAVASMGDDVSLRPGDQVFVPDPIAVRPVAVVSLRELPVQTKFDLVESTEKLGRRLILDTPALAGSPIIDANGRVVGIASADSVAIPISAVVGVFRDLFTNGKVARPRAGIHYVSLDLLPNARAAGLNETGALVTGGGKYKAVEKGSAGEAAGLAEGDVIISVEHDRINNEETLGERLQDYAPGARVELTVVRDGKQIKVSLTLK